jgi:hypothetical protein
MARPGTRQWFHLSDDAVLERFSSYKPVTVGPTSDLFKLTYSRFRMNVSALVSEVAPQLVRFAEPDDFNMLANVYLNTVPKLPRGVGVYFVPGVREQQYAAVSIYPPGGFAYPSGRTRDTGVKEAMREAIHYYATLVSMHEAGMLAISSDELVTIEDTLFALTEASPIEDGGNSSVLAAGLCARLDATTGCASPRF